MLLRRRSRALLGDLLSPYKRWIWVLVVAVVIENAARLSVPWMVRRGIDLGVPPLLEGGSGRLAALCYGLLPSTAQELVSYTVYRWECAVRASVVMGFVGAGGLGQLMDQSMKMLNGGEASSILLVFLGLVLLADLLSTFLRRLFA